MPGRRVGPDWAWPSAARSSCIARWPVGGRNVDRGSTFPDVPCPRSHDADLLHLGGIAASSVVSATSVWCAMKTRKHATLAESLRQNGYSVLEKPAVVTRPSPWPGKAQSGHSAGCQSLPKLTAGACICATVRTAYIPWWFRAFGALNNPEVEKQPDAWLEQPSETSRWRRSTDCCR